MLAWGKKPGVGLGWGRRTGGEVMEEECEGGEGAPFVRFCGASVRVRMKARAQDAQSAAKLGHI